MQIKYFKYNKSLLNYYLRAQSLDFLYETALTHPAFDLFCSVLILTTFRTFIKYSVVYLLCLLCQEYTLTSGSNSRVNSILAAVHEFNISSRNYL